MKMTYITPARILKSFVYAVPLILITSAVVSNAFATAQISGQIFIEIDANQALEIRQQTSRSITIAMSAKNGENRVVDRITLQNKHGIKDMDIFGSELMIKSELAKFRNDLKQIETQDQLEQYLGAHRKRMNARAAERGVVLD